jgi:lyso-ornithine lipid O-acyltransferase
MGMLRLYLRVAALFVCFIVCIIFNYLGRFLYSYTSWPCRFMAAAAWICGVRITITGKIAQQGRILLIPNHVGWMDIPVIARACTTVFVAQDGLEATAVIKYLASINETIFISREDKLSVGWQVSRIRDALRGYKPVTIFAEGTTSDGSTLLPFKSSLLAAVDTPIEGILVQPVALLYDKIGRSFAWIGEETGGQNMKRIFTNRQPIHVELRFLEPFKPEDVGGRKEIAAKARAQIMSAIEEYLAAE